MADESFLSRWERVIKRSKPPNLVHCALAELDPHMLTSPDGKRVEVSLDAVAKLLADPPPMLK